MNEVQLSEGYRATARRQLTFYCLVPRNSWYSFDRPQKGERLSQPWSQQQVSILKIPELRLNTVEQIFLNIHFSHAQ